VRHGFHWEEGEDPYDVYEEIVKMKLSFPNYVTNKVAIDFIKILLNKNAEARGGESYTSLKAHRFFDNFSWVQNEINPADQRGLGKTVRQANEIAIIAAKRKLDF
jgi:hypothetical protein